MDEGPARYYSPYYGHRNPHQPHPPHHGWDQFDGGFYPSTNTFPYAPLPLESLNDRPKARDTRYTETLHTGPGSKQPNRNVKKASGVTKNSTVPHPSSPIISPNHHTLPEDTQAGPNKAPAPQVLEPALNPIHPDQAGIETAEVPPLKQAYLPTQILPENRYGPRQRLRDHNGNVVRGRSRTGGNIIEEAWPYDRIRDHNRGHPYSSTFRPPQVSSSPAPEYFRLNSTGRKYGPIEFQRFDHLVAAPANFGQVSLDKVNVNCKFLFSKTKWGTLGAGSSQSRADVPAGIMYMDLVFDQPKDCKLSSATVIVTLDDQGPELDYFRAHNPHSRHAPSRKLVRHVNGEVEGIRYDDSSASRGCPVQIMDWFGPRDIIGRERVVALKEHLQIQPSIEVGGISFGGIGYARDSAKDRPSRWNFSGRLIPGSTSRKDASGRGNHFLYRGLQWNLSENDLEPQGAHSPVMHTAFSFVHSGEPVLMRVQIEGKLKGMGARMRSKLMKFPRNVRGKENSTSTLINLSDHGAFVIPLDEQARGLDLEMQMANLEANPIEIPDPMPATFRAVSPSPTTEPPADKLSSPNTIAATGSNNKSHATISGAEGRGGTQWGQTPLLPEKNTDSPSPTTIPANSANNAHKYRSQSDLPNGPTDQDLIRSVPEISALAQPPHPREDSSSTNIPTQSSEPQRHRTANKDDIATDEPRGKGDSGKAAAVAADDDDDHHHHHNHPSSSSPSLESDPWWIHQWFSFFEFWNWILAVLSSLG